MSTISSGTTLTTALVQTGDTTGNLVIKTNNGNTTAVTINTAGAIGVGSSPSYGSSGQFLQSAGNAAPATWATVPATTPGGSTTQVQYNNAGAFGGDSGFVYTGGNVGIGTSSPSGRLHVNSSGAAITYIQSTLVAGNTNVETRYISTNRTWGVGQNIIQTSSVFEIADVTANLTRLAIDSSGNVGIGTVSPGTKLEVSGNTRIYGSVSAFGNQSSLTNRMITGHDGTSAYTYASGDSTNKNTIFYSNGGDTERMRITSNGGVAFGGSANYGSSGQVLTSNGDAAPTWGSVSGTAKAWVNFNGSGGGIRASSNVSSISVNGTGRYTVNMSTAQTDANYARIITASGLSGDGNGVCSNTDVVSGNSVTATTTAFGILLTISGQSGYRDSPYVSAAVFR